MAWSAAISWIVLRPLIASMATLALNSGLWARRLLNSFGEGCALRGGAPPQRLTMGAVQKSQTTSHEANLLSEKAHHQLGWRPPLGFRHHREAHRGLEPAGAER
jgi:hypothetical protein